MVDLQELANCVISGKAPDTKALVAKAIEEGVPVADILNKGLVAGMDVVGVKFKNNEFYVPEVLIAARAMKWGMELLEPKLKEAGVEPVASVAIGTVKGDLHDIGKNLVGMMLQGAGFKVVDLGIDVPPEKFIDAAKNQNCKIVGLSALLTTTMPQMKNVITAIKEAGCTAKVMIGGAPVTQNYATEIGADGYGPDAASAVDVAKQLLAAPATAAPPAPAPKPAAKPKPKKPAPKKAAPKKAAPKKAAKKPPKKAAPKKAAKKAPKKPAKKAVKKPAKKGKK
jgi:5-methyltetrahydrofolate--homocysteine methyltransferase